MVLVVAEMLGSCSRHACASLMVLFTSMESIMDKLLSFFFAMRLLSHRFFWRNKSPLKGLIRLENFSDPAGYEMTF